MIWDFCSKHVQTPHHAEALNVSSLLVYYAFLPANAIRFIVKRQRCAITTNCPPTHRSDNLNELSNSRSSIAQYINHVRPWGSDVVVWWASHSQLLIRCTWDPSCHVQVDHSMAHMERVRNESARNHQRGDSNRKRLTYP
jgi:hypothetical protein